MIRWFARYMVVDGELHWVEGFECFDEPLHQALLATPGLQAHLAEWLQAGVIVGAA